MLLYSELTPWYRLIDPLEDHEDEAAAYVAALLGGIEGSAQTLLELGSGAGHNAYYMKRHFRCTLADLSEPMLALSGAINPECEHVVGDMRSLRLERTFDAVFVHDAVVYLTTEAEVLAMAQTVYAHTRPGGAALIAPDHVRETLREGTELIEGSEGDRSLRCLAWVWDPDPADTSYTVDYACVLREGSRTRVVHDQHVEGLFSERDWRRMLSAAGFTVETIHRPLGDASNGETDNVFLCRR